MLRPACHRCTARYGITEPVACHLPPHQTVCRRHRLWTGPAARSHGHQFDISPFPEIGRAHRRHLALAHQHGWWHVDIAVSDATRAIYQALRAGTWIPGQQRRLRRLAPSTWQQALAGVFSVSPGQPDDGPGQSVVEIAIYPDVVWLGAWTARVNRGEAGYNCSANGSCSPPDGRGNRQRYLTATGACNRWARLAHHLG